MDLFEAISQRRCIRSYTSEAVADEDVRALLEAAVRAPSSCNRQTWRFVIVRTPETIEKLHQAASYSTQHQTFVKKASVLIVVCGDLTRYDSVPYRERGITLFSIQETAAAVQNLLLAAWALGVGACWVGLFDEDVVKKALSLPKHIRPYAIITLRHTRSKTKVTPRKPLEELIHYETW